MIDVENKVFDTVYNAVILEDPNATVISDTVEEFAKFPVVTLNEIDNSTFLKTLTRQNEEQHAKVTYEVNVYCDNQTGHKAKCKQLFDAVDNALLGMKFTRTLVTRLPNVDRTIYRMYGRYYAIVSKAEVSEDGEGNTVNTHYLYRN